MAERRRPEQKIDPILEETQKAPTDVLLTSFERKLMYSASIRPLSDSRPVDVNFYTTIIDTIDPLKKISMENILTELQRRIKESDKQQLGEFSVRFISSMEIAGVVPTHYAIAIAKTFQAIGKREEKLMQPEMTTIFNVQELNTVQEAARIMRMDPATVKYLIDNGRLPAVKRGRQWFIDAKAVKNYQRSNRGPKRNDNK